ncbi:MAG: general secretion pathway protein GspK [Candidatus Hydrogenedentes bacterium]|nr:general secretion pathway protein GspK [Candidatus Hydrogenedentota bacterium]
MKPHSKKNNGFALICVLWVTAMLTVLVLGFGRRAALERRAAAYALDHEQAMMMARGAVDRGIVELHNRDALLLLLPEEHRGGTHVGESWAQSINLYLENYFDQASLFVKDEVAYVIVDEDRYININKVPREILEEIDSLKRPALRRIIARRSSEEHSEEEKTPFNAIEEIRYIKGVSEDNWFGTDRESGLRKLLTVWSDGRINVNTAPEEVLACIPGLAKGDISLILSYRASDDGMLYSQDDLGFASMDDLTDKTGIVGDSREALNKFCKCTSSYFRITGVATRRKGRIRAVCSAVVSLAQGPSVILDWQEKTLGS